MLEEIARVKMLLPDPAPARNVAPPAARTRGGFTMIEVLCVVVILAIAAAIVFAGMSNQGDLQAESAARTLLADITYAQNYAIATQQPVYITFNTATNTYSLCSSLSTVAYLTNPISHANYISTYGSGSLANLPDVSLSNVSLGSQKSMYFDELGTPWSCTSTGASATAFSAPGTIALTSGHNTSTITIQANTGDLTVQ